MKDLELQAAELDGHWLSLFPHVKVLSLDCFDTLLWRKVAAPTDVFYALCNHEKFRALGITARLRASAESRARKKKWLRNKSTEVSLEEIYQAAAPGLDAGEIRELADLEIACEIEYGFIFKPVADLIRQAKQQGLAVIIVSDTYFSEDQLRRLLFSLMPELESLIDHVFCSSAFGVSKAGKIWRHVIPAMHVRPEQICHLGDNIVADLHSAQAFGINATHLRHHAAGLSDLLAQRPQVAMQLLPELRDTAPLPSYFHAQLAAGDKSKDLASKMGYAALGPVMYAFADFLLNEIAQLEKEGNTVKPAFLMRDGFLPGKACAALGGVPVGSALNISRYTATAASLDSEEAINQVLEEGFGPDRMPALLRQLLVPVDVAEKVMRLVQRSEDRERKFVELIQQKDTLKVIQKNSAAFRARLIRHVVKATGVKSGDTLMFIDLGYNGTAQSRLQHILKQELNVDLIGRYLIAGEVSVGQKYRKGLIDPAWIDTRSITTLTRYIAAFEMMCAQGTSSTVDYTGDGEPILADSCISAGQQATVDRIQQACVQFIDDYSKLPPCHRPSMEPGQLAQATAIDLARLLYFPTVEEIDCLNDFQFDFNLGTDLTMSLFDVDKALVSMRREGLGYMSEKLESMRTNYPVELRHADISLSNLWFTHNRYGYDIAPSRISLRQESISAIVANPGAHTRHELIATPTHDGYFSMLIPVSDNFDVALMVGERYTWLQIESVQLVNQAELHDAVDMIPGEEVIFDQMQYQENGLFMLDKGSMVYFPVAKKTTKKLGCRIVFRPIAYHQDAVAH